MDHYAEILKSLEVYLVTGVCGIIAYEMHRTRESIALLNQNIAVILEKLTNHSQKIDKLDDRVTKIEVGPSAPIRGKRGHSGN